jgi:hypothetical protein
VFFIESDIQWGQKLSPNCILVENFDLNIDVNVDSKIANVKIKCIPLIQK